MGPDEFMSDDILKKQIDTIHDEWMLILDSVQDAIFIKDMYGNIQWINRACELLYNIKRVDIIGRDLDEMEDKKIFSHSVAKLVIKNKREETILHSNKAGKNLLVTGTPILDKNGHIYKIIIISRDITELVCLRDEIEDIQNKLSKIEESNIYIGKNIVFRSEKMKEVVSLAKKLGLIDTTVLITGGSGVGKGVIAKLIHESGNRKDKPFIKVNCGAIPETLLESELFGYEDGAFTGSRKDGKMGLFQAADEGTIFLDEISELPLKLQVKLLDFIQEKEIQKVGGLKRIGVNTRIIAATNRDLLKLVHENKFREDLYYRINVIPINILPLRERTDDIIPLINHFVNKFNTKFDTKKRMDPNTMGYLIQYSWPGNVRELENIIERLNIITTSDTILPQSLPNYILNNQDSSEDITIPSKLSLNEATEKLERDLIIKTFIKCKNTRDTAKELKVSQSTIVRKMQKYNISDAIMVQVDS